MAKATTKAIEQFTLFFRWAKPSFSTQEESEQRLLRFLWGLRKIDPVFQNWRSFKNGKERDVACNSAGIHELLERSLDLSYFCRVRVPGMGFNVHLQTTGPDDEYCSFSLHFGGYSAEPLQHLSESLMFEPPYVGASAKRIWPAKIADLCRLMVRVWSPLQGEVFSSETLSTVKNCNEYAVRPGWIMYSHDPDLEKVQLPAPSTIEKVRGAGCLVTVVPGTFSSQNASHVDQLKRVLPMINPPQSDARTPAQKPKRKRRGAKL